MTSLGEGTRMIKSKKAVSATSESRLQERAAGADNAFDAKHPSAGEGARIIANRNAVLVDPRIIEQRGVYYRQFLEQVDYTTLLESVKTQGVLIPVGIRLVNENRREVHVLVYGSRRLKAALEAGLKKIPAIQHGRLSDEEALVLQMRENEARSDPHLLDRAIGAYQLQKQFGWTQERIAQAFGRSQGTVSVHLRLAELVETLSDDERSALYTPGLTHRGVQQILRKNSDAAEKLAEIRALAATVPAGTDRTSPVGTRSQANRKAAREGKPFAFQIAANRNDSKAQLSLRWDQTFAKLHPAETMEATRAGVKDLLRELISRHEKTAPLVNRDLRDDYLAAIAQLRTEWGVDEDEKPRSDDSND